LRTDRSVVDALVGFARRIGKHPIVATDSPGFVVNHAGRAYGPEALRIVANGIASPQEVDTLMKESAGFRMGPFELLDLIGADVTHAVMVSIFEQYFDEPSYQPSVQMAVRVAGGLLGRKTIMMGRRLKPRRPFQCRSNRRRRRHGLRRKTGPRTLASG
jgi:3-hydroxybutyryl-CoA dehydrogenase